MTRKLHADFCISVLLIVSFIIFSSGVACALQLTIAWDAVNEPDVKGYKIFVRERMQDYDYSSPAWEGSETSTTISDLLDDTAYYFVVRAFDHNGNESDNSNEVFYNPPSNRSPAADAGKDQTVPEGSSVLLDGSRSSDPEDKITSYQWTQTSGPQVILSEPSTAQQVFTAPEVGPLGATLTFQLTVIDHKGLQAKDRCTVRITRTYTDSDGDGMPDDWEIRHGLNPETDDASEDLDGDGITNIDEFHAESDPAQEDINIPPNQPLLSSPVNGEINVLLTPELEAEAFSDTDVDDRHIRTQWQIIREQDEFIVLDVTSDSSLTLLKVPAFVLNQGTSYSWKVRFYDKFGTASSWSEVSSFTTTLTSEDLDEDGIPDSQQAVFTVDLDEDGHPDVIQTNIKTVRATVGGGHIAVSNKNSPLVTSVESLESIDAATISNSDNKPLSMPFGLLNFKLRVKNYGDIATVTIYLSEPAPAEALWYKYDSINGWQDYSRHAEISEDRKSITLKLKDGGYGDADGTENGVIIDPSGFGLTTFSYSPTDTDGGDGSCFIGSTACNLSDITAILTGRNRRENTAPLNCQISKRIKWYDQKHGCLAAAAAMLFFIFGMRELKRRRKC